MRMSDIILNSLNRLYDSKKSGVLLTNELSDLIRDIGDLTANLVSKGKINEEKLSDIYSFLPQVNCFGINHTDLAFATKTFIEGTSIALSEREKYSVTVPKTDYSYTMGFKRL